MNKDRKQALKQRRARIRHPKNPRLVADLDGAPKPIREANRVAEHAVDVRAETAAALREARAAVREAPARDREAAKAAVLDSKTVPPSVAPEAEEKVRELERQLAAVKEAESESLDRLAAVIDKHAAEWQAKRVEGLKQKQAAVLEGIDGLLTEWYELDGEFTINRWLGAFDRRAPRTLSPGKARQLADPDLDPDHALRGLRRLAEQAVDRAQVSPGGQTAKRGARIEGKAVELAA